MKTYINESIGVVPPSPIDVDALIVGERRRARRRRLGLVGGSGLLGAVVAMALITTQPWAGTLPRPAPAGSAPVATVSPSAQVIPEEEPGAAAQRLAAALRSAMTTHAKTLTFRGDDYSPEPLVFKYWFEPAVMKPNGIPTVSATSFSTSAMASDKSGSGKINVMITRAGNPRFGLPEASQRCPDPMTIADQHSCRVVDGPHGSRAVEQVLGGVGDKLVHKVWVLTSNGTLLTLDASNDGGQADDGPTTRPTPVLSLDQLTAIASEPGLNLLG